MDNKFNKDIKKISRQFLCCVPIQEISWMVSRFSRYQIKIDIMI